MGLGLYVSREIVDRHGGRIEAEFPSGGGMRVVMSLPAAPGDERTASGSRIRLVEDDRAG
jgi:K+-sensing histidine kinase KdpD